MVRILREGTLADPPPPPWYMMSLTCPSCGTVFQLEPDDLKSPKNSGGAWSVMTEKSLHGKSEATGPCPFCEKRITIARPPEMTQPEDWQRLAHDATGKG
jgi:endogenous inhibitor of DNA gyrase (YacG/DUF329 family)